MNAARKTALVTGGTSGVGLTLARALANSGAEVYFVGTSQAKGERVEQELDQGTGRFIRLDLSDLHAVRSFAQAFATEHDALDVLVNAAGVMLPTRQVTSDGNERAFTISHLAPFVLSHQLLPILANAAHGRIVNVSGAPSQLLKPSLDFDNLQLRSNYTLMRSTINAVHAKTVMTEILAEKFEPEGVDVNAFHPGAVKSDLFRNMTFPLNVIFRAARFFMSSASPTGVYATISDTLNGKTGQFIVGKKVQPLSFERAYKDRLWKATIEALPFASDTHRSASTSAPPSTAIST